MATNHRKGAEKCAETEGNSSEVGAADGQRRRGGKHGIGPTQIQGHETPNGPRAGGGR